MIKHLKYLLTGALMLGIGILVVVLVIGGLLHLIGGAGLAILYVAIAFGILSWFAGYLYHG